MRRTVILTLFLTIPSVVLAQDVVPFKLGTFEDGGETYLGLVLNDSLVVNIAEANESLGGDSPDIPTDMTDLIVGYDELAPRLRAIAAAAAADTSAAYVRKHKRCQSAPSHQDTHHLQRGIQLCAARRGDGRAARRDHRGAHSRPHSGNLGAGHRTTAARTPTCS